MRKAKDLVLFAVALCIGLASTQAALCAEPPTPLVSAYVTATPVKKFAATAILSEATRPAERRTDVPSTSVETVPLSAYPVRLKPMSAVYRGAPLVHIDPGRSA